MLDVPQIESRVGVAVGPLRHLLDGHHPDSTDHGSVDNSKDQRQFSVPVDNTIRLTVPWTVPWAIPKSSVRLTIQCREPLTVP